MPDKSKFEREIDEILEKSAGPSEPRKPRRKDSGRPTAFQPFSPSVSKRKSPRAATGIKIDPGKMIIGGLILIAIAAFMPVATLALAIAGIALTIVGYVIWFRKGSSTSAGASGGLFGRGRSNASATPKKSEPEVKYWRGRRIEDKPDRPTSDDRGKIIDFGSPKDDDEDSKN